MTNTFTFFSLSCGEQYKLGLRNRVNKALTNLIVVNILQSIHVSNHHIIRVTYTLTLKLI